MVLGLRSKNKRAASVHVDYIIHIKEVRPWPSSQSLKSLRSVAIQWENGDRRSGSTHPVAPTLGSSAAEGRIEFNESFKLQVAFLKEGSTKGRDTGAFQKNLLELSLYEPRRDRAVKGQHLGTAVVDLAEHGSIKEAVAVSVPVNSKRSYRNAGQPVLHLRIQPVDKDGASSSSGESLSKEASLDKDGKESVSALMNEEYAEEAEIASFTDDDEDEEESLSSLANSSSAPEVNAESPAPRSPGLQDRVENASHLVKEIGGLSSEGSNLHSESLPTEPAVAASDLNGAHPAVYRNGRLPQSSVDMSNNPETLDGVDAFLSSSAPRSSMLVSEKSGIPSSHNFSTSVTSGSMEGEAIRSNTKEVAKRDDLIQEVQEERVDCSCKTDAAEYPVNHKEIGGIPDKVESSDVDVKMEIPILASNAVAENDNNEEGKPKESRNGSEEVASRHGADDLLAENEGKQLEDRPIVKLRENPSPSIKVQSLDDGPDSKSIASLSSIEHTPVSQQHTFLRNRRKTSLSIDSTLYSKRALGEKGYSTFTNDRLKNLKSVRSPQDSKRSNTNGPSEQYKEDVKEIDLPDDTCNGGLKSATDDGIDDYASTISSADEQKHVSRINRNGFSNNQVRDLELRVQLLEQELREAAAVEIGLFSVVAEHGSSAQKVHTPARRISRLYIHASKQTSRERRASAARSAVSGLVLAAKACGNDVPRLAFWLSNLVVLRTIIRQRIKNSDIAKTAGPYSPQNGFGTVPKRQSSPLKWESTSRRKGNFSFSEDFDDWEDPDTFIFALEKIETWMFSRIAESVWWQTLTSHMQPAIDGQPKMGLHLRKSFGRTSSTGDQQRAYISIEIWKKAFNDASERLCPVRAGGHECGCLPMLSRLVMEQCVARLDVAMFNAILRESDDEIPTDPVSDPISDPKVLPIPSGKLSFGAGAQLKNAIGNWSRWLTDLFGMDLDDYPQVKAEKDDDRLDVVESFKSFCLLNALSDLLMLPKDMLLEKTIRKEVCPTFSTSIIKRILDNFLPDEFCPDPIPEAVVEALNSEDPTEGGAEEIRNVPCSASPILYSPPSVASVESIIGDVRSVPPLQRSGSSVVRKCHTSDDELDELDSPLMSFVLDKSPTPTARSNGSTAEKALRYQLLREVWRDDE